MFIPQARRAFLAFPLDRTTIERSKLGWLLIAMIDGDTLLAAGAWFAIGYIIGK
jgi:hypothetical protein